MSLPFLVPPLTSVRGRTMKALMDTPFHQALATASQGFGLNPKSPRSLDYAAMPKQTTVVSIEEGRILQ